MENKKCKNCNIEKSIKDFYTTNKEKGYLDSLCILCRKEYVRKWQIENPEKRKKTLKKYDNSEKGITNKKEYQESHRQEAVERAKKWAIHNREKLNANRRKNAKTKEGREKARLRARRKRQESIDQRIRETLRARLNVAIKDNYKNGSAVKDLGMPIILFKLYIASKWKPGMCWNNYGRTGWHLDHIKPLASFDLTNREEFLKSCHYSNYQPLWAKENLSKGCKHL